MHSGIPSVVQSTTMGFWPKTTTVDFIDGIPGVALFLQLNFLQVKTKTFKLFKNGPITFLIESTYCYFKMA